RKPAYELFTGLEFRRVLFRSASMAEVMTAPYIRTAVLKGIPFPRVILRHGLRNALIPPFTVIMLQINWLLSGVVVVEFFFAYKEIGRASCRETADSSAGVPAR